MKNNHYVQTVNQAITALVVALAFLLPLTFSPYTANLFDLPKTVLLVLIGSVILALWMIKMMLSGSVRISSTPVTMPLTLLVVVSLVSSFFGLPQFVAGFVGTTAPLVFLWLVFVVVTTIKPARFLANGVMVALGLAGAVLGIFAVLETVGMGPSALMAALVPGFGSDSFITPAGTPVMLISFLIPVLAMSLYLAIVKKSPLIKSSFFAIAAVLTSALVIGVFTILPGKPSTPTFMPFDTAWVVAMENTKSPRTLFLGVGPQNYISAFSAYKPASFNATEFWNSRFSVSRNWPLHLFTTTGLIGLAAYFWLVLRLFKITRKFASLPQMTQVSLVGTWIVLGLTLFIPMNLLLLSLLILLLMVATAELKASKQPFSLELILKLFAAKLVTTQRFEPEPDNQGKAKALPYTVGVPVILLSLFLVYGSLRVYAGDVAFGQSLLAASQNLGTQTYDKQLKAVEINPYSSLYRRNYATTNLALANSLSQQQGLSDQDQETVAALIRQGIREARNSVILEPSNPVNWETLASIYRQLINVAEGSVDWTITSYTETIARDPNNPRLRVELGGVYYQLEQYQSAIRLFEQAVILKPDYANARYNLAAALVQEDLLPQAVIQYEQIIPLLEPASADFARAQEELAELRARIGEAAIAPQPPAQELATPEPLPTPDPENQIILDDSNAPPTDQTGGSRGFSDLVEEVDEATAAAGE